jgi:hypothetical protein
MKAVILVVELVMLVVLGIEVVLLEVFVLAV